MQIGIISDIHDHISNLRAALKSLQKCDALICCGDLCSPFIIKELGEGYSRNVHIVFGNNDGDLYRITQTAKSYDHLKLYGEFCELNLDGKRFAINHYDNLGRALSRSGAYDVICFGHNHRFEVKQEGQALIINPGEIMGELTGTSTFVVYDTLSHSATRHEIK